MNDRQLLDKHKCLYVKHSELDCYITLYNATKKDSKFYVCVECEHPVCLKEGKIKTRHFAHHPGSKCGYFSNSGESLEHLEMKEQIKQFIEKGNILKIQRTCSFCPFITELCIENKNLEVKLEYIGENRKWIADIALLENNIIQTIIEVCNTHRTTTERPFDWVEVSTCNLSELKEINKGDPGAVFKINCIRDDYTCKRCCQNLKTVEENKNIFEYMVTVKDKDFLRWYDSLYFPYFVRETFNCGMSYFTIEKASPKISKELFDYLIYRNIPWGNLTIDKIILNPNLSNTFKRCFPDSKNIIHDLQEAGCKLGSPEIETVLTTDLWGTGINRRTIVELLIKNKNCKWGKFTIECITSSSVFKAVEECITNDPELDTIKYLRGIGCKWSDNRIEVVINSDLFGIIKEYAAGSDIIDYLMDVGCQWGELTPNILFKTNLLSCY